MIEFLQGLYSGLLHDLVMVSFLYRNDAYTLDFAVWISCNVVGLLWTELGRSIAWSWCNKSYFVAYYRMVMLVLQVNIS